MAQAEIQAPNVPPWAPPDEYGVDEDGALVVPAETGVLANDTDPGPDREKFRAKVIEGRGPTHGSLHFDADGLLDLVGQDSVRIVPRAHAKGAATK